MCVCGMKLHSRQEVLTLKKILIPLMAAFTLGAVPIVTSACVIEGTGTACDDGGCHPVKIHITYPGPC
jgi:hypothetical protein